MVYDYSRRSIEYAPTLARASALVALGAVLDIVTDIQGFQAFESNPIQHADNLAGATMGAAIGGLGAYIHARRDPDTTGHLQVSEQSFTRFRRRGVWITGVAATAINCAISSKLGMQPVSIGSVWGGYVAAMTSGLFVWEKYDYNK